MTPIRRFVLALALAPVVACGGGGAPSEVRLRFEYAEGDTLVYRYHTEGTVSVPDTSQPSGRASYPYERNITVEEAVLDVTASGNYLLAWNFHVPPEATASDSGTPAPPQQVQLTIEITPQGRILSIGGVETARPLFGEIDFQSYFEQTQPVFPDRALKVGDSWTQEVKVLSPSSEPVVTTSTYVLERLVEEEGAQLAVIAFDGDIYLPFPHPPAGGDSTGAAMTSEERIRVTGEMFFALETGRVLRVVTNADATLTKVEIEDGQPVRREAQFRETTRYEIEDP